MDRLGRRREGLEDVRHATGRGGECRTHQKGRGNKDKESSSDRPATKEKDSEIAPRRR